MTDERPLIFAREAEEVAEDASGPWKVLIADDEKEVHHITRLALQDFSLDRRPIEFISAYTGREAIEMMVRHPDVAMILMDVVMESEHAGLEAVDAIRNGLNNNFVRIVLRTGQPGQAPEHDVIRRYDINDYKEKTELTAAKLFTLSYTSLCQYRDMVALDRSRMGLERILGAASTVFRRREPARLARGALQALTTLLGAGTRNDQSGAGDFVITRGKDGLGEVLAATGEFANASGRPAEEAAPEYVRESLLGLPMKQGWTLEGTGFRGLAQGSQGALSAFWVQSRQPLIQPDPQIIDIFLRNAAIALDNAELNQEINKTQRELIVMMSEAIEKRSLETGNHVRRVGEFARLLGRLAGLSPLEADRLFLAAPLHDIGKIAIPDAVLNKPGRHTDAERSVMETHAELGAAIFEGQNLPVLQAAAVVAGQHHERWDGNGYPSGLRGEEIHLYGRITCLVDVFDALGSVRCYKQPWPLDDIKALITAERGKQFDPHLVDLLMENMDRFLDIRQRLPDEDETLTPGGDPPAAG